MQVPPGAKRLRVWIALPQEDDAQDLSDLKLVAPVPHRIEKDSEGNRVAYLESANPAAGELALVETFTITRREVRQSVDPGKASPIIAEDRTRFQRYLEPNQHIVVDDRVRKLADEIAGSETNPVIAARKLPRERTALHVCRGNWTPHEEAALRGDYGALLDYFRGVEVGAYLLEMCTPRAGDVSVLRALPDQSRIGVGCVNQKLTKVESVQSIVERGRRAIDLFGAERLLLHPDCGFATFADNPLSSAAGAEAKLAAIVEAARQLPGQHRLRALPSGPGSSL